MRPGFDWHSSGVTTTVTGAVKEALRGREHDLGVYAGGGKGAVSRRTRRRLRTHCERLSIDAAPLVYASRMSAKVDSAAVQEGISSTITRSSLRDPATGALFSRNERR